MKNKFYEIKDIFIGWHKYLLINKNFLYPLRSCRKLEDVFKTLAYWQLKKIMQKNDFIVNDKNEYRVATIACCLSYLDEESHLQYHHFVKKMADKKINQKPLINEVLFMRLLKINNEKMFFDVFINLIRQIDQFDFEWFARDLFIWNETVKREWCENYYTTLGE